MAAPDTFTAVADVSAAAIEQQIVELEDSIAFLEDLWLQEPDIQQQIDPDEWKAFMDAVYQGLWELQDLKTENVQLE